jgi:hypothetical protein
MAAEDASHQNAARVIRLRALAGRAFTSCGRDGGASERAAGRDASIAVTEGGSPAERSRAAIRAAVAVIVILGIVALAGKALLAAFSISAVPHRHHDRVAPLARVSTDRCC